MKRQVLTGFCFRRDSITGELVAKVMRSDLGFAPTRICCSEAGILRPSALSKTRLQAVEKLDIVTQLRLETSAGLEGPSFDVATVGSCDMQVLYWKTPDTHAPSLELSNELAVLPIFNAGATTDADDVFWQSEETVSTHDIAGRATDSLPMVNDLAFGGLKVDIRQNPGRRTPFPGMWLLAGWRNWYGPGALRYFDIEALMSFKEAVAVERLGNAAVFIQLYQDVWDASTPDNRVRQRLLRDSLGFDVLEANAASYAGDLDPVYELETGHFEHGGVRRLIEYFDVNSRTTRRSRATYRVVNELDKTGRAVFEVSQPMSQ